MSRPENLVTRTVEVLQTLNDGGLTIVMVTHEPDIAQFARRMALCRDGHIRTDEPVASRTSARQALAAWPSDEDQSHQKPAVAMASRLP